MFLECKSYDDYWALTKNDLYHLKEDGDESRCYIIDDNGTELDVYYTDYVECANCGSVTHVEGVERCLLQLTS